MTEDGSVLEWDMTQEHIVFVLTGKILALVCSVASIFAYFKLHGLWHKYYFFKTKIWLAFVQIMAHFIRMCYFLFSISSLGVSTYV